MTQKKAKAEVCPVQIGLLEIQGIMLSDGTFGLAVPQIADLFLDSRNTASRDLKRLMGESFKTSKMFTEFNKNTTLFIDLKTFELVLLKLDRSGNQKAQAFRDDLVGLSLHQMFCDSFNIQFEKEERKDWWQARKRGKENRRSCTDALRDWLAKYGTRLTPEQIGYRYAEITDSIYLGIFGCDSRELKEQKGCQNLRDAFSEAELDLIKDVEKLFARILDRNGDRITPRTAVKQALARLEIVPIQAD